MIYSQIFYGVFNENNCFIYALKTPLIHSLMKIFIGQLCLIQNNFPFFNKKTVKF